ncbi:type IV pilin [Halobacterium rubrum]|uniref:type IV pilin n=1 Tax=Halobacterium TaxID=2239 RepID=UPI001F1DD599|nr:MULTISPECIES: type IV pilin N-terminal domain-containing protein [Halobacterium]MDH5020407.1 type IV pilin N-terminal domain-containing protein [Halobacterium rubrum]
MTKISLFDDMEMEDRGVSPVIGVILMVAITVILAAVIASAVLGFGSNVQNNAQAGVTVDSGNVTVTSLGSSTAGAYCTNTTDEYNSSSNLATVGVTIDNCDGGNVVAVTEDNSSTVVRTDI